MERSQHFRDMLKERDIAEEWVERCERNPDKKEDHEDGTRHFIKQIHEFGNRWLRVIIDISVEPNKEITAFFDRRLRRKHED